MRRQADDETNGRPNVPSVAHREATVNGVRLHYVLAGEETAEPIVLLHGFPQSWLMWRMVLPALAERYFVVAVDLRGYGDSEKPAREAGHDQGTKASDVHQLVRLLGLDRAMMISHDRGARVARRYALDYPDAILERAMREAVSHLHFGD